MTPKNVEKLQEILRETFDYSYDTDGMLEVIEIAQELPLETDFIEELESDYELECSRRGIENLKAAMTETAEYYEKKLDSEGKLVIDVK